MPHAKESRSPVPYSFHEPYVLYFLNCDILVNNFPNANMDLIRSKTMVASPEI
jgi:hypothetical protein